MSTATLATILWATVPFQLEDWGRVFFVSVPLLAAIFAGIAVIHYARRQVPDRPTTTDERLAQFREAHEAGEIDDDEFRRLLDLLVSPGQPRGADLARKPRTTDVDNPSGRAGAEPPPPTRPDEQPPAGAI